MKTHQPQYHVSIAETIVRTMKLRVLYQSLPLWRLFFSKEIMLPYIFLIILKIFNVFLAYLPPIFTDSYLRSLSMVKIEEKPMSLWVYYQGFFIIFLLYIQAFIGDWIETQRNAFSLKLKTWLNILLIEKTLRTQHLASSKHSESSSNTPNLLNLITQDVSKLENGMRSLIETFGIIIELISGVSYLYSQLSHMASFSGLSWLILCLMIGNISIVAISQIFGLRGQKARDIRVSLLQEVFQGIKQIKTLSWEDVFIKRIEKTRLEEFKNIRMIRIIDAFFNSMIRSIGFIILLVLSIWLEGTVMTEKLDLYSALVLINQLVYPITAFPWNIGSAIGMVFPYMRLQGYMNSKEVEQQEKHYKDGGVMIKDLEYQWKIGVPGINIKELYISKGSFVMIYGANGAGKTTLLRLMLGELNADKGYISIDKGDVAYVSQDTWLMNGTFEENIILDKPFDSTSYENCLKACSLYEEVLYKEKGFEIGLNGSRLSGGQRQRLALCRALYQDKEVYLLDDIFSSLDEKVAEEILNEYVIKGLVNRGKTIIFITSQERYLHIAHEAYELNSGELVKIVKKSRVIQEVMKKLDIKSPDEKIIKLCEGDKQDNKPHKMILQPFSSKGIKRYLKALGLKPLLLIISISITQQATRHYSEIYFNDILTSSGSSPSQNSYHIAVIFMVLTLARGLFYCYGVLKVSQLIFKEILKALLHANIDFYEEYQPGELINYLTRDIDSLDCNLPEDFNGWASTMINISGIFVVITYEFPVLIAVCWVIANQAFKYYRTHSQMNKLLKQIIKDKESKVFNELMELSQGVIMIRALKKDGFFLNKALKAYKSFLIEDYKGFLSHKDLVYQTIKLTLTCSISIILSSLLYYSIYQTPYDPKALGIALSYSLLLSKHLIDAICSTISLETELLSLQRLTSLEVSSKKPLIYPTRDAYIDAIDNNEHIMKFDKVSLSYGDTMALYNISFEVKALEKVAFCGRTGSGKTSIFSLILQLYPYQKGLISYQGKALEDWGTEELRGSMAMIPQNGFLFKGTLKENLDPMGKFSEEVLCQYIKEYKLEDVFQGKTMKSQVQREGSNLSNGEKQLINFLQNVLTDKPMILLDEATSNLDWKLDLRIMALLKKICEKKTLLLISHRLESLDFFDRIYVLDKGRIVETGTYTSLSKNPVSLFNSLRSKLPHNN